jgi:phenylacetate-coenzyme A ligase PaaK-like adenylate-forming protein
VVRRFGESVADPRLTLERVLAHYNETPTAPLAGVYHVFVSAGKSGSLAPFVYDYSMWRSFLEATRRRLPPGFEPSRVALLGTADPRHTLPRSARAFEGVPVLTVGLQDGLRHCLEALGRFQPDLVVGFSSAVALVAEAQINGDVRIAPEVVLIGTDGAPDAKQLVRAAWNRPALDVYATTEAGVIAFECWEGGALHVNEDMVRLELHERGVRVTSLENAVQPIIRYEIPDVVREVATTCRCQLPFRKVELVQGRSTPTWRLPGRDEPTVIVHPIVIRSAVDGVAGVARSSARLDGRRFVVTIEGRTSRSTVRGRIEDALARAGVDTRRLRLEIAVEEPA